MWRWTRIGNFALTDDLTEATHGPAAQAMLGLIHEDSIEAHDLRRFFWELGYFDVHRMGQREVLATLEHCLRTSVVGLLPWARMQEILFTPRSSEIRANGDAEAGESPGPRASQSSRQAPQAAKPPTRVEPAGITRSNSTAPQEPPPRREVSSKAVIPKSLAQAQAQLAKRRAEITAKGYTPKYTDEELLAMAQHGNVGGERFQMRFMEKGYLQASGTPAIPLSGALG